MFFNATPPPCARHSTKAKELFETLHELYEWIEDQRQEFSGDDEYPEIPPVKLSRMSLEDFIHNIPILVMSGTWEGLNAIRNRFDLVFREFGTEELWDLPRVRLMRKGILLMSVKAYQCAFMGPEQTEMRFAEEMQGRSAKALVWLYNAEPPEGE